MNKLPSDWQIKTLNEVCFPSNSNIAYKDVKDKKGDYPIYGASGIVAYSDFYSKEKECIGIVKDGSVGKIFILEIIRKKKSLFLRLKLKNKSPND